MESIENLSDKVEKCKYRILNIDGSIFNAGTELPSWFKLKDARKIVNYSIGQKIVEHDGINILWETF